MIQHFQRHGPNTIAENTAVPLHVIYQTDCDTKIIQRDEVRRFRESLANSGRTSRWRTDVTEMPQVANDVVIGIRYAIAEKLSHELMVSLNSDVQKWVTRMGGQTARRIWQTKMR